MKEIWKPIKRYIGKYEISNYGRVKSLSRYVHHYVKKEQLLKPAFSWEKKYIYVNLSKNNKLKAYLVHRLVAEHFLEKPNGKNFVNHIDNNGLNNKVDNIEWCTRSENLIHAIKMGNRPSNGVVIQYDLNMNFIAKYKTRQEAEKIIGTYGLARGIYKCASGENKTAFGFIWKFEKPIIKGRYNYGQKDKR